MSLTMEDAEQFISNARQVRGSLLDFAKPYFIHLITLSVIAYMLNWVFVNYGFERLCISCTLLLASLLISLNKKVG